VLGGAKQFVAKMSPKQRLLKGLGDEMVDVIEREIMFRLVFQKE